MKKYKDKEWLYSKYWLEGFNQRELAKFANCSKTTISYWMRRSGIPSRGDAAYAKYNVNTNFFKSWSSEMAWILGLLFADGCIKNNRYIELVSKDKDLLILVSNLLEYDGPIKIVSNGYSDKLYYSLCVFRKEMVKDVAVYGLYPHKSMTMKFPEVPDEYFWDFVRGYFDGDGSVVSVRNKYLNVSFASGSRAFLEKLNSSNHRFGLSLRNIGHYKCHILAYSKTSDVHLLYKNMYYNTKVPCLYRKYKRFLNHFGGYNEI